VSVPLVSLTFFFFSLHHFSLTFCPLSLEFFCSLFYPHFWLLEVHGEPRMRTLFAMWPLWTEATQVERTDLLLLVVFECAVRTKWTEATIVVWTGGSLGFGVDVEVEAVVAVGACLGSGVV
jgi:hypothetical protein